MQSNKVPTHMLTTSSIYKCFLISFVSSYLDSGLFLFPILFMTFSLVPLLLLFLLLFWFFFIFGLFLHVFFFEYVIVILITNTLRSLREYDRKTSNNILASYWLKYCHCRQFMVAYHEFSLFCVFFLFVSSLLLLAGIHFPALVFVAISIGFV